MLFWQVYNCHSHASYMAALALKAQTMAQLTTPEVTVLELVSQNTHTHTHTHTVYTVTECTCMIDECNAYTSSLCTYKQSSKQNYTENLSSHKTLLVKSVLTSGAGLTKMEVGRVLMTGAAPRPSFSRWYRRSRVGRETSPVATGKRLKVIV